MDIMKAEHEVNAFLAARYTINCCPYSFKSLVSVWKLVIYWWIRMLVDAMSVLIMIAIISLCRLSTDSFMMWPCRMCLALGNMQTSNDNITYQFYLVYQIRCANKHMLNMCLSCLTVTREMFAALNFYWTGLSFCVLFLWCLLTLPDVLKERENLAVAYGVLILLAIS